MVRFEFLSSSWKAISSRKSLGARRNIVGHRTVRETGACIQSVQTDLNSAAGTRNLILINDGYLRVKRKAHAQQPYRAGDVPQQRGAQGLRSRAAATACSNHGTTPNACMTAPGGVARTHARTSACGRTITAEGASSVFTGKTL